MNEERKTNPIIFGIPIVLAVIAVIAATILGVRSSSHIQTTNSDERKYDKYEHGGRIIGSMAEKEFLDSQISLVGMEMEKLDPDRYRMPPEFKKIIPRMGKNRYETSESLSSETPEIKKRRSELEAQRADLVAKRDKANASRKEPYIEESGLERILRRDGILALSWAILFSVFGGFMVWIGVTGKIPERTPIPLSSAERRSIVAGMGFILLAGGLLGIAVVAMIGVL